MENPEQKIDVVPSRSLWKNRPFLLLIGSTTSSSLGLFMYSLVIPILLYSMTQSPLLISTMRLLEFLVGGTLGVVAGVLVDRINRKTALISAAVLQWITIATLTLFLFMGNIQLWALYFFGFLYFTSGLLNTNAGHAALPQIVAKDQLTEANAKLGIFKDSVRLFGPLVAGASVATLSYAGAMSIQLLFVTVTLSCVLFLPSLEIKTVKKQEQRSIWKETKEGFHEIFHNPLLRVTTYVIFFQNFGFSLTIGILLFFAVDYLQATPQQIGAYLSIGGIGGLLGLFAVKRLVDRFPRGKVYTYTNIFDILFFVMLAFATSWWMIAIGMALYSFSTAISNTIYHAVRQELTPNDMLGRVSGSVATIVQLTMPLGVILSGLWAEFFDIRVIFYVNIVFSTAILLCLMRTTFHKTVK
ncbi:MFS transporter [Shouchella miscanthi]|uniref:MFS transporter n=1 Tax=Shouchella miscanthi TaxID=2598861 RepID=A0ABU6NQU5_9BACI|nr:MFS transporter [Shouchella miscanthi]